MPKTHPLPQPTTAELEILRVLWRRGAATVREVHEELQPRRPVGYTTVLKLMQIMAEKGLVTRDQSARTHVYKAAVSGKSTRRRLVSDLVDRAFDGSASGLVMQALSAGRASAEEIERIRKLLDEMEKGGRS
ncbi:MAG: BlaI/MecI/CopY family transcriptional regulator [Candidatus Polarisedimenticolia bacterium]